MKVIAINEECHGQIAIASDYPHAIMWLVNNNWLTDNTEVNSKLHLDWEPIKDWLGEDWVDYITEKWDIKDFNDFFDGSFRLEEIEIYGTDNKQEEEEKEHYYILNGTWSAGIFAYSEEEAKKWFKETWTKQDVEIDMENFIIKEFN